jgi:hypothetical protein
MRRPAVRRGWKAERTAWQNMHSRCRSDPDYTGRGIVVCERWESFDAFLADMGPRPSPRHSIDRVENSGNYEPGNCRWATPEQQMRNTRRNRIVSFRGQTMTLADAAELAGTTVALKTIHGRLDRGWSLAEALASPKRVVGSTRGEALYASVGGSRVPLKLACAKLGISYATVVSRLRRGWPMARALRTAVRLL